MIENYLGFPQGVSGSELAMRASAQAKRFGAEILLARHLEDIGKDGSRFTVVVRRLSRNISNRDAYCKGCRSASS